MQIKQMCCRLMALVMVTLAVWALPARAAAADPRDDASPWGVGSGAEWAKEFPKFNPMLDQAGVKWLRTWPEWVTIQPKQGEWNWEYSDKLVADAKANNLRVLPVWCYFAKWASADGGTRKGPIKDIQYWKDYVAASVERYKADVKYWEVWNEVNGSFYGGRQGMDRVKDYAELVVSAYDAARKIDPGAKIGMSVASSDIGFLDLVIKAGAADHFDFICIHPYENLDAVRYGDEPGFLSLGTSLRQMLAANKQPVGTPVWITEIGGGAPVEADPAHDAGQASLLAKSYLLSLAQGFQRVFWFEARGPAYGSGTDFGIIRPDWTTRPSYTALKTMIGILGQEPSRIGWLETGRGGYGFVFQGAAGPVLAAWSPVGRECRATFAEEVRITDLTGGESTLASGKDLVLDNTPVFIGGLPEELVEQARENADKPFPWGGDYSNAGEISCRMGGKNTDEGLRQIFLRPDHENRTAPATVDGMSCRRVVSKDKDNSFGYFRADPRFAPYGVRALEITVVARRAAPDQAAEMSITYETTGGYKDFQKGGEVWAIPAGDGWQEHTWRVGDACFANKWGWHLGLIATGDTKEFLVKEVRVAKIPAGGGK